MFADAVSLNAVHGRPLSAQEKARIIDKLKEMKFSKAEISRIMRIPIDKIDRFSFKVITNALTGEKYYLKAVVEESVAKNPELMEKIEKGEIDQESLSIRRQKQLLFQLFLMLKNDLLVLDEAEIRKLAINVCKLLLQKLKIAKKI